MFKSYSSAHILFVIFSSLQIVMQVHNNFIIIKPCTIPLVNVFIKLHTTNGVIMACISIPHIPMHNIHSAARPYSSESSLKEQSKYSRFLAIGVD